MSTDTTGTEVTATETTGATAEQQDQHKPTETVDFWKAKAREQEKRAKDNAAAAKRLAELEDAQKTEAERAAERIAKAEAEVAALPAKIAEALRRHLVALHRIEQGDADLVLTATDPEVLLKQAEWLLERSDKAKKTGNVVPRVGATTTTVTPTADAAEREFVRDLFGSGG
jgi:hypothetical protein